MDRCIKVEQARYVGRMHWLGFNTQRITHERDGQASGHHESPSAVTGMDGRRDWLQSSETRRL